MRCCPLQALDRGCAGVVSHSLLVMSLRRVYVLKMRTLLGSPWSGQGDQQTVPGKELSRELATSNCQIAIESLIMESGLNDKVQLDYIWVWFPVLALPVSVVSCSCLCGQDSVCLVPTPPPPLGEWTCSPAGSTALKSRLSVSATTLSAPLR